MSRSSFNEIKGSYQPSIKFDAKGRRLCRGHGMTHCCSACASARYPFLSTPTVLKLKALFAVLSFDRRYPIPLLPQITWNSRAPVQEEPTRLRSKAVPISGRRTLGVVVGGKPGPLHAEEVEEVKVLEIDCERLFCEPRWAH